MDTFVATPVQLVEHSQQPSRLLPSSNSLLPISNNSLLGAARTHVHPSQLRAFSPTQNSASPALFTFPDCLATVRSGQPSPAFSADGLFPAVASSHCRKINYSFRSYFSALPHLVLLCTILSFLFACSCYLLVI